MAYHILFIHFIIYLKTAFAFMQVKKLVTPQNSSYMRVQQTEEDSAWMWDLTDQWELEHVNLSLTYITTKVLGLVAPWNLPKQIITLDVVYRR